MLLTILSLVVVLGVLIFVHEAGHFIAAKAMGIQVLRFSLGFREAARAGTAGRDGVLHLLDTARRLREDGGPRGRGIAGELEGGAGTVAVDPERAFDRKPVWKRMVVILAGVTMNAIFAFVVYTMLAYQGTLQADRLATTAVDSVRASESAAAGRGARGLPRGSRIVTVNGDSVSTWGELLERLVDRTEPDPARSRRARRAHRADAGRRRTPPRACSSRGG